MAKVLIVRRRKFILILLITILLFLLVINANRLEWQVNKHKRTISESRTTIKQKNHVGALEPEPETSKPEEEILKPERELTSQGPGTSQTPLTQANKLNKCQPKTNIVFIKTVKTGGSTLTNILSRFAMKHNLNIHGHEGCLHPGLSHRMCQLKELRLNYSSLGRSNIISEHILYNRKTLSDVMPNDTVYVTQLRQPLTQLNSWLNYRGHSNLTNPVEEFRNLPLEFKFSRWNSWRQMCVPQNVTAEKFQSSLDQLGKEFDLVTITEQFDLSLLLLRRKLCWDISDMLYIPLKKANYALNHNIDMMSISKNNTFDRAYQKLNPNAYRIYRYFEKKISLLIASEGYDIKEELKWFQKLKQTVSNYCSHYIEHIVQNRTKYIINTDFSNILHIPANKWGKASTVDPVKCAMMKFHKETFQKLSILKDLKQNKYKQPLSKVTINNKVAELLKLLRESIHPEYGIPLSVLNYAHAYDLDEHVFLHGKVIQKDFNQFNVQRRAVADIDRCVAENEPDFS